MDNILEGGNIFIFKSFLEHQGLGGVVDVLGGQSEVNELFPGGKPESVESFLDVIFNGLDIVVGDLLYILDFRGIFRGHAGI